MYKNYIVDASYFEYTFGCEESCISESTTVLNDQVRTFNGGGSGG